MHGSRRNIFTKQAEKYESVKRSLSKDTATNVISNLISHSGDSKPSANNWSYQRAKKRQKAAKITGGWWQFYAANLCDGSTAMR